jgi:hypothetical protein
VNRLSTFAKSQVIAALVEGVSINSSCRMTGVAKHTVLKLLKDLGCAAASYHDAHVRNLRIRRVQADKMVYRLSHWCSRGKARPEAHLNIIRGAAEPLDANGYAPVYATDKCFQQEAGEPRSCRGAVFYPLQLFPCSQDPSRNTSDGSGIDRSCLDSRGTTAIGSIVRAERLDFHYVR